MNIQFPPDDLNGDQSNRVLEHWRDRYRDQREYDAQIALRTRIACWILAVMIAELIIGWLAQS